MARPRSRSPMHPFRSSSLYRRSPGRREDRCYSSDLPREVSDFIPRGVADRTQWDGWDRTAQKAELWEDYAHDSRRRAHSPDQWREFPSDRMRFSPPAEFGSHRGSPKPASQLGYAERHRLSPKKRFHTPDDGGSQRPHDDFQRSQDGRARPSPRRFSHEDSLPDRYASAGQRRAPSPGWDRVERIPGSEPIPDPMLRSSLAHSPRPNPGRSMWGEPCDSLGSVPNRETRFSGEFHGRSPYSERYTEEHQFRERRRSSERTRDARRLDDRDPHWGQRRSSERAPVIVEHDHGIAHCGMKRESTGERHNRNHDHNRNRDRDHNRDRDRNSTHTREGPSERFQRGAGQQGRGVAGSRRAEANVGRFQSKRSPSLSERRQGEVPQTYSRHRDSPHFLERLTPVANGDVDLRRMEPTGTGKPGPPPQALGLSRGQRGIKQKKIRYQRKGLKSLSPEAPSGAPVQETLTIKVDVQRPAAQNRQLSLDLVNVGRQRLDFLPMLEHSGTNRETTLHSGTFAQEIITLVHQVKENYFKGEGLTLNERFSSVQGAQSEEDGGPSSSPVIHRLIDVSQSDIKTQPIFKKVGCLQQRRRQLADDPCDLRHDLERRRQERLERVKVTIPGGSFSQRPLLTGSVLSEDEEGDEGGSSSQSWPGEGCEGAAGQWGGETGTVGQKRPGYSQQGVGAPGKFGRQQINRQKQRRRPNRGCRSDQHGSGGSW